MPILQNHRIALLVILVSIILLSPCKIIFAADTMPTFTEDDFADCTITGMKLDHVYYYATETFTESSGAFWDENGIPQEPSTSFIDFLLYYYLSAEEARTDYREETASLKEYCQAPPTGGDKILQCDVSDNETTVVHATEIQGNTAYRGTYAMIYDEHYFSIFQFELPPPATEQQAWDMLAQTKACIMQVINSKDRKFSGKVTNFWGEELPGMVVKLSYNGKEYETTTDENGTYRIPFEGTFGKKAKLTLVMQCREEQVTYFTIISNGQTLTPHIVQEEFIIRTDDDLKHDAVVQDSRSGTEFLGYVYRRIVEAIAIYAGVLKVQPEPCIILPYSSRKTSYLPQEKGIQIRDSHTVYKEYNGPWRSGYIEYHEYSHHIMYCMYGSKFPAPPADAQPPETNHGGYMNPSTSDSFVEGFADFMSSVMLAMLKGQTVPKISGAEEINQRAWDGCGYAEEDAVTGVLWDLYDGTNPLDSDSIQLSIEEIWAVLKDYRANMHEVYKAFVETYPDRKPEIDQVFINHGFFADKNEGNKQYDFGEPTRGRPELRDDPYIDIANPVQRDIGETIGQATNYQRPERYSKEPWPNHFIKTSTAYPLYKISFAFPEHPYLNYELYQEQQEGLIYVPVPPETYNAQITIEGYGDDITTGNPLSFTNQEFIASYGTTIEQGYYQEHEFQIDGTAPPRPATDPSLTNPGGNSCLASELLGTDEKRLTTLRRFRDEVLVKSAIGKKLVQLYYANSKTVIEALESHESYRRIAAALLKTTVPLIEMTLT